MKEINIKTATAKSKIIFYEGLANLEKYLHGNKRALVITDENVYKIYKNEFPKRPVITLKHGEKSKSLKTIEYVFSEALKIGIDRTDFIVGIGGGVTTDIAGFAASCYNRGVRFGFVPTTLLAQVDASIGGKNGVNFKGYKNIIGTLRQPEFILIDPNFLKTLPRKEFFIGLVEAIKAALIADKELFSYISENLRDILNLKKEALEEVIVKSASIKARIVEKDENESGARRLLNFGHTLGHAIESVKRVTHGEAVAAGMIFAAKFSEKLGYLRAEDKKIVVKIINRINLGEIFVEKDRILDAVFKDKKREGEEINFVFLRGIGDAFVKKISFNELSDGIDDLR